MAQTFDDLVAAARAQVHELFPWDLTEELAAGATPFLVDIREPYEYATMHVAGSVNVPRGILETACEWDFEETVPELAAGRDRDIVLLCRSGNRTVLAAQVMTTMGFTRVRSLRTGLRGWNDFELPLVDGHGRPVAIDAADDYFAPRVSEAQRRPTRC